MNENRNDTVKWLQYLMYVGIAALVNALLGIIGLNRLTGWIGLAINVATIYLLFMLSGSNSRYKTAAIWRAVSLAGGLISNAILGLVASICGIVAQYQEYHAHGELVADRDPKLEDKWSSLFGMEIAVTVVGILLTGLAVGTLAALTDMSEDAITPIVTILVAVLSVGLEVLYLSYLKKTIALLETEAAG